MFKIRIWDKYDDTWTYPEEVDWQNRQDLVDLYGIPASYFYDGNDFIDNLSIKKPCLSFCRKDTNGFNIYIGDILKINRSYLKSPVIFIYDKKVNELALLAAKVRYIDKNIPNDERTPQEQRKYPLHNNKVEIIGNTMENPELIPEWFTSEKTWRFGQWKPDPQYGLIRV